MTFQQSMNQLAARHSEDEVRYATEQYLAECGHERYHIEIVHGGYAVVDSQAERPESKYLCYCTRENAQRIARALNVVDQAGPEK